MTVFKLVVSIVVFLLGFGSMINSLLEAISVDSSKSDRYWRKLLWSMAAALSATVMMLAMVAAMTAGVKH